MTPAWAFLILATLLVVIGLAFSWLSAVRRQQSYDRFVASKNSRQEDAR